MQPTLFELPPIEWNVEPDLSLLHNYSRVENPQAVGEILNIIDRQPKVAFDLETTGLDRNRSSIHGVALANDTNEWYVMGAALPALLEGMKPLAAKRDLLWIGHNLRFDVHFLDKYGIRPARYFDTMVAQALIDENQELGLKSLSQRKLGVTQDLPGFKDLLKLAKDKLKKKRTDEITIFDLPIDLLAPYAGRDARLTYDLEPICVGELAAEGMTDLFLDVETPFLYTVLDMEKNGFYIDTQAMDVVAKEFEEKINDASERWARLSKGINPNSPKQLQVYLYDKANGLGFPVTRYTDSKQPATDALAIMRLAHKDKTGSLAALTELRKYEKLYNTYILNFQNMMFNGRLYGDFNQTGTVTWRLSSSNPNLQNIPARGDTGDMVRTLFAATPGYSMVVADYSQIELRLLAHYSKDPDFIKLFIEGGDPHQQTADLVGISRRDAKAVNFGWIYGIGPDGLADSIEKTGHPRPSRGDTQDWLDGFSRARPVVTAWKNAAIRHARKLGYIKTIDGHKRRLPDINSRDRGLSSSAERQAVNSIIQGSAAVLIKYAMLQINPFLGEFGARMLAQVHDELVFEVPEKYAKEFADRAKASMESVEEHYNIRVPVLAEPGIGPNWAKSKK